MDTSSPGRRGGLSAEASAATHTAVEVIVPNCVRLGPDDPDPPARRARDLLDPGDATRRHPPCVEAVASVDPCDDLIERHPFGCLLRIVSYAHSDDVRVVLRLVSRYLLCADNAKISHRFLPNSVTFRRPRRLRRASRSCVFRGRLGSSMTTRSFAASRQRDRLRRGVAVPCGSERRQPDPATAPAPFARECRLCQVLLVSGSGSLTHP